MDIDKFITSGISALGLLGGLVSYILNLKVRHDLMVNNEKIDLQITNLQDKLQKLIYSTHDNLVRELGGAHEKLNDKLERIDRDVTELRSNLNDRIISTVNGKYVRTDLHQQTIINVQERFESLKQIIENQMDRIEQSLDRQILDLKDRILHDKQ
jgi:gamma-glutamyl:cysteine ligase YbdK (ATP-grasp superfamily)